MAERAKRRKQKGLIRMAVAEGSFDLIFFIAVTLLLVIGLVMLFSASYPYALQKYKNSTHFFYRQLVFAVMGYVLMIVLSRVRFEYYRLAALFGFFASLFLLVLVLFTPAVKVGHHRWLTIPGLTGFTIQPSEIAKLGIIMFCAWQFDKHYKLINSKELINVGFAKKLSRITNGRIRLTVSFVALMAYGAIILLFAGLVFLENHLSGTILMVSIGIIMLYLGGFDKKWFIAGIVIVGVVVAVFALFPSLRPNVLQEYMTERIVAWLDKDFEPTGARWQVNQALYAIGSGGFFGAGLGNSKQKYMYVSEPQNDMIFSIVCEELGFVGAVIILLLFAVLVWRGVVIGLKCKSRFGALLSMGIVFQVGLQTVLNIAVATDSIPNTGIGLPFFSYGGSSLLILLAEMGMILSVSRYSAVNKK